MASDKPYRNNVGIIVFNRAGKLLAGERIGEPGSFQFPQGGVDPGEDLVVAARRELWEETGLDLDCPPVFEVPEWLHYDFPPEMTCRLAKKYRGQRQRWYFYYWDDDIASLEYQGDDAEFMDLVWMDFDSVRETIVPFKRGVYDALNPYVSLTVPEYISNLD